MKKTLVIHPQDRSTDFLKPIYANIPNVTVITGGKTQKEINQLIDEHDRIIMMGHGCPDGLFSIGRFPDSHGLVISNSNVPHLMNKENIGIWCNADGFFKPRNLPGFFSGMFISEVGEAWYCLRKDYPRKDVEESNDVFAQILGEHSTKDLNVIHEKVTNEYGKFAESSDIARYNNNRLYIQ